MSEENVQVVRRGVDALNARDLERHYAESFDPKVEWRAAAEDPDAATHEGLEAYKRYLEEWLKSFDELRAHVEECIDAGDDRVLAWIRYTGRGRASGAPADWHLAIVFTLRNGKGVRGEEYFDRNAALEAAGLSA